MKRATSPKRTLSIAFVLVLIFVIIEVCGGIISGSLAIVSDAAHMLTDLSSFGIGLLAIWISGWQPSKSYGFGYFRAEILSSLAIVVSIWIMSALLLYLAIQRFQFDEFELDPDVMIAVAGLAVIFNVILGVVLHQPCSGDDKEAGLASGHSHKHVNVHAALIHVIGDLIQSVGVLISAITIKIFPSCKWLDPACTGVFSVIVFCTTLPITRQLLNTLMEGKPRDLDYDTVWTSLKELEGVAEVQELRMWSLTSDRRACVCHLNIKSQNQTLYQQVQSQASNLLKNNFSLAETTIQINLA